MTSNQKVVIVTGGSSGIGRATAVALARDERAKVVIAARREKEGEETAGDLTKMNEAKPGKTVESRTSLRLRTC